MYAIRPAGEADTYGIVAVVNLAFEFNFLIGERTSYSEVARLMETSSFFVAAGGSAIVGAVQVQTNGTTGYFAMLSVDPRLRRNGIGRTLREVAENYCRAHGCTEMTLTTASNRPELIQYYARAGYKPIGIESQPAELRFKEKFDFIRMAKTL